MGIPKTFPLGDSSGDKGVDAVIKVMDKWFWLIEDEQTRGKMPNPKNRLPKEEVDKVIEYIDKEIDYEVTQHTQFFGDRQGIHEKADFRRLEGTAREAFVQEILASKEKNGIPRKSNTFY